MSSTCKVNYKMQRNVNQCLCTKDTSILVGEASQTQNSLEYNLRLDFLFFFPPCQFLLSAAVSPLPGLFNLILTISPVGTCPYYFHLIGE